MAASALYTVYLPGTFTLIVCSILFIYILNSTNPGFTLTSVAVKLTSLSNPNVANLQSIIFISLGAYISSPFIKAKSDILNNFAFAFK
ncbi:hypothetical protein D3C73_1193030 [compost metagenome]